MDKSHAEMSELPEIAHGHAQISACYRLSRQSSQDDKRQNTEKFSVNTGLTGVYIYVLCRLTSGKRLW